MTALANILLVGGAGRRALELTLDSVLGQTETRFLLYAAQQDIGEAGAGVMAAYADPRFVLVEDKTACAAALRGQTVSLLRAGDLLAPTFLAQLAKSLVQSEAVLAACDATLFDGNTMQAAPKLPPSSADFAAELLAGFSPPASTIALRLSAFLKLQVGLHDIGALCRAMLEFGDAVPVAQKLAIIRTMPQAAPARGPESAPAKLFGRTYIPADVDAERPPTLHVVVDTEAEFDWDQPFATHLTEVSALSGIGTAQRIFDRYGLRPTYVIDYPVASQPEGVAAIHAIADRGACAVGAHLHPWANPPFGETTSRRLSFPGNLPSELEAAKLDSLLEAIARNFSITPPFYKAGRYGLGPNTAALIAARGAKVDYSLMPQTDLRRQDGPDFSAIDPIPYHVEGTGLLALPMTRAHLGRLASRRGLYAWLDGEMATSLHIPGILARTGLLERLTVTPEGVPYGQQIRLIRALLAQGHRMFVLHYHSPSLVAGHTPYVRNEADRVELLGRIDAVCTWFFEELGGLPGRPWDLLPPPDRKSQTNPF